MKKIYLYLALGTAIVLAAVVYLVLKPDFIEYKDIGLSMEDKEVFEARARDEQEKIANFTRETSSEEKFRAYLFLGRAQFSLGQFADAEESYEKAIKTGVKGSSLLNAWYELYNVRFNMEDYKGARDAIRTAIDMAPTNVDYWRALYYLERDGFKSDEEILKNLHTFAVEKSNGDPNVIGMYAFYLESTSDVMGAIEQWKIVLEDMPNNQLAKDQIQRLESQLK